MKVLPLYRSPVALAAALAIAAAAFPALAQTAKDAAGTTAAQPAATNASTDAKAAAPAGKATPSSQLSARDREAMKLSDDGFTAMRAVRAARIAIFNGDPKMAHDMLSTAESSLHAASKDLTALDANAKTSQPAGSQATGNTKTADNAEYVAIDGQITLVDSFIDSPAKKAHIDKANEHIAKGKAKNAMDELRLAEVDASFTRVMMPLEATTKHVDAAAKLVDENKFYEANLALKAAEDGLLLDSVMLSETPAAKAGAAPATPAATAGQTKQQSSGSSAAPQQPAPKTPS